MHLVEIFGGCRLSMGVHSDVFPRCFAPLVAGETSNTFSLGTTLPRPLVSIFFLFLWVNVDVSAAEMCLSTPDGELLRICRIYTFCPCRKGCLTCRQLLMHYAETRLCRTMKKPPTRVGFELRATELPVRS